MRLTADASVISAKAIYAEVVVHCGSKISLEKKVKSLLLNCSKKSITEKMLQQQCHIIVADAVAHVFE